jgi:hypothetical protein
MLILLWINFNDKDQSEDTYDSKSHVSGACETKIASNKKLP